MSQTACPETHTAAIDMGAQYGLTRKHTASHCGAAIHAASRMPVHKITMTRKRQRTALFCMGILIHHNTHTRSIHSSQVRTDFSASLRSTMPLSRRVWSSLGANTALRRLTAASAGRRSKHSARLFVFFDTADNSCKITASHHGLTFTVWLRMKC